MTTKEAKFERLYTPLKPTREVILLTGDKQETLLPDNIEVCMVGQKAYGLASLPEVWSKPFFVISGTESVDAHILNLLLNQFGFDGTSKLLVRSSGANETMHERGVNSSFESTPADILETINALQENGDATMHWVVQQVIPTIAKGHLSNERRISKADRDWLAEIEAAHGHSYESETIAIRTWRDSRFLSPKRLACQYKENYIDRLTEVSRWAFKRIIRVHFEWVWDGYDIYIVQADEWIDDLQGVKPEVVVRIPEQLDQTLTLSVFKKATENDFKKYRKIANAALYQDIGYSISNFYVLKDAEILKALIDHGEIEEALLSDLAVLTARPLVIRTDGLGIPEDDRTMLPRSDELRSVEDALEWLKGKFRKEIQMNLGNYQLCLVAHHFIPATASAWCQAHHNQRRVRIESLWGIPEGLYYNSHDVFEIDTVELGTLIGNAPKKLPMKKRVRFKGQFIAPNNNGEWVLCRTSTGPDWSPCGQKTHSY